MSVCGVCGGGGGGSVLTYLKVGSIAFVLQCLGLLVHSHYSK